jgi:hypothetical protein
MKIASVMVGAIVAALAMSNASAQEYRLHLSDKYHANIPMGEMDFFIHDEQNNYVGSIGIGCNDYFAHWTLYAKFGEDVDAHKVKEFETVTLIDLIGSNDADASTVSKITVNTETNEVQKYYTTSFDKNSFFPIDLFFDTILYKGVINIKPKDRDDLKISIEVPWRLVSGNERQFQIMQKKCEGLRTHPIIWN